MVSKMLPLAVVVALFLASGAWCAPLPVTFFYYGNVNPEDDNSAGAGLRFVNQKGVDGAVIYDPAAIDGMAFEIVDNLDDGCVSGSRASYVLWPNAGIQYATIVGRFKVISDTHVSADCPPGNPRSDVAAGNLGILQPITASPYKWGNSACLHWGGANNHIEDIWRDQGTPVSGDADYHIFRMTIDGFKGGLPEPWNDDFEAYAINSVDPLLNERGTLTGQGLWTGNAPGGMDATPALKWGLTVVDDGPPHNKCLAFVTSAAAATPAEVFGDSIAVLVAPDATTKQMVVEFDIKGTDPDGGRWDVSVLDINGVNIASLQGGAMSCRLRINSGPTDTTRALTGGTTWDHLKLVIDTTPDVNGKKYAKFYLNGVIAPLFPNGLDYTQANPSRVVDMIGQVTFNSPYDFQGRFITYFDNFHAEGDPVTPAMLAAAGTSARTIKIYKDEDLGGANLSPVLVINTAGPVDSNDDLGIEGFLFGTDDTLARQTVCFDWVSGSNQGAFAPGAEVSVIGKSLVPTALTQPIAKTVVDARAEADGTAVVISEVVAASYIDDNYANWFFGIEESDRTAGIKVLSTYGATPGEKVSIHGVLATTDDRERVIQAIDVSQVDPGPFDIPGALCMNNKAIAGPAWNRDGFDYPDGALPGNGTWTGTMPVGVLEVLGGELKFKRGNGPLDAITNLIWDASKTTYKVSFNVKKSTFAGTSTNNFWRMILKSNETLHREIGRWEGYWAKAVPQYGTTPVGPDVPLTTDYQKLTIEFTPAKLPDQPDGDHSNVVNFLVNDVQVWTHTYYSSPGTSPRYPYSITLQNQNRGTADLQHVWLDDLTLENMEFPVGFSPPRVGANNVGLLVRLYGKVTESYFDLLAPSYNTSYFYIDDGSGLLGDPPHQGVRCMAPNTLSAADVPAVDSYVSAYGILGMRNGQRYLYTLSWDPYP